MSEKPIIFSAEMVRAILDGRKTETRRVVKNPRGSRVDVQKAEFVQPYSNALGFCNCWSFCRVINQSCTDEYRQAACNRMAIDTLRCPYGVSGDRLWVRESFQPLYDDKAAHGDCDYETGAGYKIRYVATEGITDWLDANTGIITDRILPSIHMPKWAARLWLEVVEVRVERVQNMGNYSWVADFYPTLAEQSRALESFVGERFQKEHSKKFWDRLNTKRGFGWDANPWVFVIRFKRSKRP